MLESGCRLPTRMTAPRRMRFPLPDHRRLVLHSFSSLHTKSMSCDPIKWDYESGVDLPFDQALRNGGSLPKTLWSLFCTYLAQLPVRHCTSLPKCCSCVRTHASPLPLSLTLLQPRQRCSPVGSCLLGSHRTFRGQFLHPRNRSKR